MRHQFFLQLTFILFATHISFAQEVQYRDYKDSVSWKNYYDEIENPKYSPFAASSLSFFFPSAGYFYINESRRGGYVLLGQVAIIGMFFYGLFSSIGIAPPIFPDNIFFQVISFYGPFFFSTFYRTWAAIDAGKICMEKNLFYQYQGNQMSFKRELKLIHPIPDSTSYGLKPSIPF